MAIYQKRFFPVIHCISPDDGGVEHAIENVAIALNNFADGVFLIGHGMTHDSLCKVYAEVRKEFPHAWLGINFLDIQKDWKLLEKTAKKCHKLNGLWIDRAPRALIEISDDTEIFGGVAFKYIDSEICGEDLVRACEDVHSFVDVITTSGDETGVPPNAAKISEIKTATNEHRLALASGVSVENISRFFLVDDFLVATSITERVEEKDNREYLNPQKTAELGVRIREGTLCPTSWW